MLSSSQILVVFVQGVTCICLCIQALLCKKPKYPDNTSCDAVFQLQYVNKEFKFPSGPVDVSQNYENSQLA